MNNAPAAAPAESAEIVSAGQGETSAVTEEVESLRTAEIQKITEMLSKAAKHSEQNEFKEAFSLYLQSEKTLDTLPDTSYTRPLRKKIESMRQLSQSKYADILLQSYMDEYMTKIDKGTHNRKPDQTAFENAKILLEKLDEVLGVYYLGVLPGNDINNAALDRARAKSPKFAEEIDGYKNKCTKVVDAYNFFAETSLQAVDPNADKRNADIQSLLAKGKAYFRANDFGKAKETYEQVFIYDPFNAEANEQLQKIYKKMNFYAEQRAYSEMLKISAQTEWAFNLGL